MLTKLLRWEKLILSILLITIILFLVMLKMNLANSIYNSVLTSAMTGAKYGSYAESIAWPPGTFSAALSGFGMGIINGTGAAAKATYYCKDKTMKTMEALSLIEIKREMKLLKIWVKKKQMKLWI